MQSIKIIILAFISINIFSQNITNTLGTSGLFTIKDGATNYFSLSQSTGEVNILKTLRLENTANGTTGVLLKGTDRFLHNYGTDNTFLGINSGNFTMSGGNNTAVGFQSLQLNSTGSWNTAVGYESLHDNTTGRSNTAVGRGSLTNNTTGIENTAVGYVSLFNNINGSWNTAVGTYSLQYNTTGSKNTAVGWESLIVNSTGSDNTALGLGSLNSNTSGYENTAVGSESLYSNSTGYDNTALGYRSLRFNSTGIDNTAVGYQSLYSNTTGFDNTALGLGSLYFNTTGHENTAFGVACLGNNTSGSFNTGMGYSSLFTNTSGFNNTAVGHHSLQNNTGNYNTALGYNAGSTITTGANLTCIGIDAAPTSPTAVDQITLGNIFVSSLRCNVTTITSLSDMRDKKNIKDLSLGLDFIAKLKPRQFNWDKREWYDDNISDGSKMKETPTAGFIAQELDSAQTNANAEWLNLVLKDNPEKWEATPGNLFPIVVKAIQDLKEEKDNEIAELKTENIELKERLQKIEQLQKMLADEIEKLKSSGKESVIKVSESK